VPFPFRVLARLKIPAVPRTNAVSFLAIAAGQLSFHGELFLRIGMFVGIRRLMMAVPQRRVRGWGCSRDCDRMGAICYKFVTEND
jgi:hypothetical protein